MAEPKLRSRFPGMSTHAASASAGNNERVHPWELSCPLGAPLGVSEYQIQLYSNCQGLSGPTNEPWAMTMINSIPKAEQPKTLSGVERSEAVRRKVEKGGKAPSQRMRLESTFCADHQLKLYREVNWDPIQNMGYLLAEDEESLFVQPQWNLSLSALGTDIRACANSSTTPANQAVPDSPLT
ncbi:hypothetical protein H920_12514 [Fukomys damarensis]|uniref:Uncharacterized protein n=1 Tax=Fukomys damarensis TaxID=885580 RepID=A0A091D6J0_FUKDA|nr:hypothetical protein H920_12514 [Fukomys damarensis]